MASPDYPGKEDVGEADLSPAATTIAFDPVLPLLRIPVAASLEDDPSKGPFVLAFRNEASWRRAWRHCEEHLISQCEAVARKGCSVSASRACRTPWWRGVLGKLNKSVAEDEGERLACEEKHMVACLASAREEGVKFARGICEEVFSEARIAEYMKPERDRCPSTKLPGEAPEDEEGKRGRSTNFRGKKLMMMDSEKQSSEFA